MSSLQESKLNKSSEKSVAVDAPLSALESGVRHRPSRFAFLYTKKSKIIAGAVIILMLVLTVTVAVVLSTGRPKGREVSSGVSNSFSAGTDGYSDHTDQEPGTKDCATGGNPSSGNPTEPPVTPIPNPPPTTGSPFDLNSPTPPSTAGSPSPIIVKCNVPGQIAMTFDDGPSVKIPAILNKLQALDVKATFFVNSDNFAKLEVLNDPSRGYLNDIYEFGHQVGTHTYQHALMDDASTQTRWDQMRLNDLAIYSIIGKTPLHFRAPELKYSQEMQRDLGSWGYTIIGVNLDTLDWNMTGDLLPQLESFLTTSISNSNAATDSFISLHHDFIDVDLSWIDTYVNAARNKGFEFVTSSECVGVPAYR